MQTIIDEVGPEICAIVGARIDKLGAVYTDEIMRGTGVSRETITSWLKDNNFKKTGGCTSRRWQNEEWKKRFDNGKTC